VWIVPNNLNLSSAFVADTLESKEDLSLPGLQLEHSLMWRSKPSPLPTWSRRWKRTPWLQHLSGRILKPSQHTCFEIELTSLLEAIPASHFQQQESAQEKMTLDTSGLGSENISKQCDLFDVSLKTSRDTSVSDSEKSSKTWKDLVTKRRGEYSARLKSAHLTSENESISLPTPSATQYGSNQGGAAGRTGKVRHSLESMANHNLWPTPQARDWRAGSDPESGRLKRKTSQGWSPNLNDEVLKWPTPTTQDNNQVKGKGKRGTTLGGAVRNWPTPTASDSQGGPRQMDGKRGRALKDLPNPAWPTPTTQDANKATKKMRDDHQNNLTAVVFHQETFPTPATGDAEKYRLSGNSQASNCLAAKARRGELEQFPTPTARDWKGGYTEAALTRKDGKSRRFDALPNAAIGGVGTDIKAGHLNPDWVEWLMGVPTGWTDLGSWGTE